MNSSCSSSYKRPKVAMLAVATVASTALEATLEVTSTKPEPVLVAMLAVVDATATVALAVTEATLETPPVTALAIPPNILVDFLGGSAGAGVVAS